MGYMTEQLTLTSKKQTVTIPFEDKLTFSFAQTQPFCECMQEPEETLIRATTHKWLFSCFPKLPRRRGRKL